MIKPNTISMAFDAAALEKPVKLLESLIKKIREYNKEVERSNRLLREQENLRKKLNVKVEKGKTIGLVEKE